jgi:hypothetical protein
MEPRAKQDTVGLPMDDRMVATVDGMFEVLFRDLRATYIAGLTGALRQEWSLGGDVTTPTTSTSLVPIPGAVVVEFDADPLYEDGVQVVPLAVQFMGQVTSGTGFARLYNRALDRYYTPEIPFVATQPTLITAAVLDLPRVRYPYELHVRDASGADAPLVWGAKLITR